MSEKNRPLKIRATPWKTSTDEKVAGALGEIPSYVRRAKAVEDAIARFHRALRKEWVERLEITALKVRRLVDLGEEALRAHGGDLDHEALAALRAELEPLDAYRRVRSRAPGTPRPQDVARALKEARRSVRRFNAAWEARLAEEEAYAYVNERIDGYNRWYEFERQCSLKYVPLDQAAGPAIEPITPDVAAEAHPPLSCP